MPAIANLSLNDGQATPVAHTYAVQTTNGQKASFQDRIGDSPIGYQTLDFEVRPAVGANAASRVIINFSWPTTGTVDNVLKVVRYSSAKLEINISQTSTLQDRKDFVAYIKNLFSNSSVATAIQNLEPFY